MRDPWTVKDVDWVFCENISRFVPTALADDFRADVISTIQQALRLQKANLQRPAHS